jgi:hypothetical protein
MLCTVNKHPNFEEAPCYYETKLITVISSAAKPYLHPQHLPGLNLF